jgi:hypothetical protein
MYNSKLGVIDINTGSFVLLVNTKKYIQMS